MVPSIPPTISPTSTPVSSSPTTICELGLDLNCTIANGDFMGQTCDSPRLCLDETNCPTVRGRYGSDITNLFSKDVELLSLTVLTNFIGLQDVTDPVRGVVLEPGETLQVVLPFMADLTSRQRTILLAQVAGAVVSSGLVCSGTAFESFVPGAPTETTVPSPPPTISPAPTPDLPTSPCRVRAEIACKALSSDPTGPNSFSACENVADPSNDLQATGIGFIYRVGDGLPNSVFVTVQGRRTGVVFSEVVNAGESFYAEGDFRGQAQVTLSTITTDDQPGQTVYNDTIDVSCAQGNTTLTLTNKFGPLELSAFRNALGYQSSVYTVQITYTVFNEEGFTMVVEDAFVNSGFHDATFDAIQDDQFLEKFTNLQVFDEEQSVLFAEKFSDGNTVTFAMNVTGRAAVSGKSCSDEVIYSF